MNFISRLQHSDPSKTNAWLISTFNAIVTFLITLQPELNKVNGWQSAVLVIVFALVPHAQGLLTSKDAYKRSTVDILVALAHEDGVKAGKSLVQEKPTKKATTPKVKKTAPAVESESQATPKPPVKKTSKAKKKTARPTTKPQPKQATTNPPLGE